MIRELKKFDADINALDQAQETPLFYAIFYNQVEAARCLVDLGAQTNI